MIETPISKNFKDIDYYKIKGLSSCCRVLIFLPGLGAFKENYIEFLNNFKLDYSSIYCLSLPEQGSKGVWTVGFIVDNLKEFIEFINDSNENEIHISGHSIGALSCLSFIVNYNSESEYELNQLDLNEVSLKKNQKNFIPNEPKESLMVTKLILFSPPDSFKVVLPPKLINYLKNKSLKKIKKILNIFINSPQKFFGYFNTKSYFKFKKNKLGNAQYFNLVVKDYNKIFEYVLRYNTIFELYKYSDFSFKSRVNNIVSNKQIIIHYGAFDWLLKPYFKRRIEIESNFNLNNSIRICRYKSLGHLLNRKNSLNINLNNQMITNKKVISYTKHFINNTYEN